MFIITGGTGHVGSETAKALLHAGQPVTIVTRDQGKGAEWKNRGAAVAVADAHDVDGMRDVFRCGKRLFLLNPPADPSTDTDAVERETVRCLLAALDGSGLEKVVAESTYGAQPGCHCGDLNILYELEEGLRSQPIPTSIIRAAYYFSNWDALLKPAADEGVLPTMYPVDLVIPMVAPSDLGRIAATLLTEPVGTVGLHHVEGPERYSSGDVATAFSKALGRAVRPIVSRRDQWEQAFLDLGFSATAASSYSRMTAVSVDGDFDMPVAPIRGTVTLDDYIANLAQTGTYISLAQDFATTRRGKMKLYGTPPTRAIRVQWLLNELGIECEVVALDPMASNPEFQALNPADKVPVLVDGDVVLTESAAIPLYLAEKYPEKGLIPADLVDRAQMYRWMFFLVTEIEQPLWRIARNTFIYAEEDRVPADIANATRDCKKMVAVFEEHMAEREFVVGDRVSVVDFIAAYTLDWADEGGMLADAPRLRSYVDTMYARPTAPMTIKEGIAALRS